MESQILPAELCEMAETFMRILPFDFLRYVLGAGGVYLLVNVFLSRRLEPRKIRRERPALRQMQREVMVSMRTVLLFALIGATLITGGVRIGLISIDETVSERGALYFLFNVGMLILLHDAWFYWTHRLIHMPSLFRIMHRLHHRSHNPTPFTAYAFNIGEALINALYLPVVLVLLPSSGAAIFVFLVHMILRNAIGHCGYELFPARPDGRPMIDLLTTVTHHDLHHARPGFNYGLYFTWWDRMMGTEHPQYHQAFARAAGKAGPVAADGA